MKKQTQKQKIKALRKAFMEVYNKLTYNDRVILQCSAEKMSMKEISNKTGIPRKIIEERIPELRKKVHDETNKILTDS